ncbi:hypothetical protein JQS43_25555 [Natronosporangium hydrolyticum]|uniref:Uncharacterized protein n=1 Tax=Natronosporangium hydrolyticum TaxID=2811111 RepID=A0A895YLL0_9ACTN|nr:hypothetical protein [Natronosporangium hydrolyticum]QSB14768.1 hypothetical protein JQS43_25555 [Natronosporangium hydrolyticum]
MIDNKHWVRAPAPPHRRPAHYDAGRPEPATLLRALLLGVVVFVAALLAAGLLAGAAPAGPAEPVTGDAADAADAAGSTVSVAEQQPPAAQADLDFAHSMVVSGLVALTLSVIGTVMVARRRRLW